LERLNVFIGDLMVESPSTDALLTVKKEEIEDYTWCAPLTKNELVVKYSTHHSFAMYSFCEPTLADFSDDSETGVIG